MLLSRTAFLALCLLPICSAQLTQQQKLTDFNQLASLYAVNYGPYELKRDVFGFDLFKLQPWLDQVTQSKTDIDFYDICVKYVASLQDAHDEFTIPSNFEAWLHVNGDIYDGKFIIDFIDRTYLPRTKYPFTIGDELVSVDDVPVATLLQNFAPYAAAGASNPVSNKRLAAGAVTDRFQGYNPRAGDIGEDATVVVQRTDGGTETYSVPWDIFGTRLVNAGIIPVPHTLRAPAGRPVTHSRRGGDRGGENTANPWHVWDGPPANFERETTPQYREPLAKLSNLNVVTGRANLAHFSGIFPFGNPAPVFNPPSGFVMRLGGRSTDQFLSGTFKSGTNTIGFIRIPTFDPPSTSVALSQFAGEVAYFQQNTDGLMIDVMANGGGDGCYTQTLTSYLMPSTFQGLGEQLRATTLWRLDFDAGLAIAKLSSAPQWIIDLYTQYLAEIDQALSENRGLTGNLPVCAYTFDVNPPKDRTGAILSYTKPVLVLTDNFTGSAAEIFAMFLQENGRAPIFGTRTSGAGGNVVGYESATNYSQGATRVTLGLITRLKPVAVPGYAASLYYEGVGIYPDIVEDYMTMDNLNSGGATFVKDAVAALNALIAKAK